LQGYEVYSYFSIPDDRFDYTVNVECPQSGQRYDFYLVSDKHPACQMCELLAALWAVKTVQKSVLC
jgi:hypothetical protein